MPRNTPLSTLLVMLKAKIGNSTTVGTADDAIFKQELADYQQFLAVEYDWPFLINRFDKTIPPTSRYLTFPVTNDQAAAAIIDHERPILCEVFWNNLWSNVMYGIGSEQYNYLNSDQPGRVQDPIQNWRWSNEDQFEIWPVNTITTQLRFTGVRDLNPLIAPSDTADLDDLLIVLGLAAQILQRRKQADATTKQQMFQERLHRIRSAYPTTPKGLIFGTSDDAYQKPRLTSIAVHGS